MDDLAEQHRALKKSYFRLISMHRSELASFIIMGERRAIIPKTVTTLPSERFYSSILWRVYISSIFQFVLLLESDEQT